MVDEGGTLPVGTGFDYETVPLRACGSGTTTNHPVSAKYKLEYCKTNGWGYCDTRYWYNRASGNVEVTGSRYANSGYLLPKFTEFAFDMGFEPERSLEPQSRISVPPPTCINDLFLNDLRAFLSGIEICRTAEARLLHGHGHTCQEIWTLRYGSFDRLPDVIVYPSSKEDVEGIVRLAVKHGVCLIPYGGGTNVTMAVTCPTDEKRMIVSIDMSKMQRVIYVDVEGLTAKIEAGIVGCDLDRELRRYGVTLGHEPDSSEFSTLGGWIASNASGMKKNAYGNIEDLILDVTVVTPIGVLSRGATWPRISSGPDILNLVLGSEGTLGIITDATVIVRPLPQVTKHDCLIFPSFAEGSKFMRQAARERIKPSSMRLMDNLQTRLGATIKPAAGVEHNSVMQLAMEKIKKFYLTQIRGLDLEEMCACTISYEGSQDLVEYQEASVERLAIQFKCFSAGLSTGQLGYNMTFAMAYIRDMLLDSGFLGESFEMSVPWANITACVEAVRQTIHDDCKRNLVKYEPFISVCITQTYDAGACLYFYAWFCTYGLNNAIHLFSEIEHNVTKVATQCGASISHHQGVGKLRKQHLPKSIGSTALFILKGLKNIVDPTNIMGNQNLI